jgi:hypothetical protein
MSFLGCYVRAKRRERRREREERSERVIVGNVKVFVRHLEKETAGQPAAYGGSRSSKPPNFFILKLLKLRPRQVFLLLASAPQNH